MIRNQMSENTDYAETDQDQTSLHDDQKGILEKDSIHDESEQLDLNANYMNQYASEDQFADQSPQFVQQSSNVAEL